MTHSLLRSLIRETLLTEEVYGAQAVVYHGTEADPEDLVSALLNDEFRPGEGGGSMYGKGLYTVYDLKETQTEFLHTSRKSSHEPLSPPLPHP